MIYNKLHPAKSQIPVHFYCSNTANFTKNELVCKLTSIGFAMVIRTIKLTSLFVNTENYRFEPLSSQKEAIDKMIEDQGDKLYSLVDDIVTNGLSPVDLIIVTPNEDSNKYVVLEGNRRITSLKLLNNPTLIDDKYSPCLLYTSPSPRD